MVLTEVCDYTEMVHSWLNSTAIVMLWQREGGEKKRGKQQQNLLWTASEYEEAPPLSRAVISCYFLPRFWVLIALPQAKCKAELANIEEVQPGGKINYSVKHFTFPLW